MRGTNRRRIVGSLVGLALSLAPAAAPAVAQPVVPAPAQTGAIPLGTGGVDGAMGPEMWSRTKDQYTVRNVVAATLTPVLPAKGKGTGVAVVVAPGGAFRTLSMDLEGQEIARWLADHGIAAFVLKYRLVPTARDLPTFARDMAALMKGAVVQPGEGRKIPISPYAVQDGAAALRLVRARAAEFGVDPARVGMMGFSAGAVTIVQVAVQATPETMPAFIAPVYPSMDAVTVPAGAPPMFVAMASDDPLYGRGGYGLVDSWAQARRKVEFHLFLRWLDMNGLIKPAG